MSWIAAGIPGRPAPIRLTGLCGRPSMPADAPLLARGTLLIDTDWPETCAPPTVFRVGSSRRGELGLGLALFSDGQIVAELDGGEQPIAIAPRGPGGDGVVLRYHWDAPARRAALSATRADGSAFTFARILNPPPLPLADLLDFVRGLSAGRMAALSTRWEPTGPVATLAPETRLLTPTGPAALTRLRPGATVIMADGQQAAIRWRGIQWLPTAGSLRPLLMRAPYHGVGMDVTCLGTQSVEISGSMAEYLFGAEAVLARASDLLDHRTVCLDRGAPVRAFAQVLLDRPGLLAVPGGGAFEPFDIGGIMARPSLRQATLLADLPQEMMPGGPAAPWLPRLKPYEAASLRATAA